MPVCLGKFRGCEPLLDKICADCNNKIGKLEDQFSHCGPEAFFRWRKGITGRKHHKKHSIFYRGSAGGRYITMETEHPLLDCKIFVKVEAGSQNNIIYPARQIIFKCSSGKHSAILISEEIKKPDVLRCKLKEKKIDGKPVECWAETPEDVELMKRLTEGFNVKIEWVATTPYSKVKRRSIAEFVVDSKYFRAIAKISFHYFLEQFPIFSGMENEFDDIKNFIMNGDDISKWVQQEKHQFVKQLQNGARPDKDIHILTIEKNGNIIGRVQLFVGPNFLPFPYRVFIGKNPMRICYPESIGHQFTYYKKPDAESYWGIMQQMNAVSRKFVI